MREQLHSKWYALQLEWECNILKTFRAATADQIVEGRRWYPQAIKTLTELRLTSGLQLDSKSVAAICAVLSPRITWGENIKGVAAMLRAVRQGSSLLPAGIAGLAKNRARAWDIARGLLTTDAVSGPKVTAFYANLCGDYQRVTLDVWAARAAGVDEAQHDHIDRYRYVYLERAYKVVAEELGFLPAELQAICWIVVRGKGE